MAAVLLILGACADEPPEVIVAAPASSRASPDRAVPPAAETTPGQQQGQAQVPSSAELLARVDALKGQLGGASKTVEIMAALGDLYYEHQRLPDALGWYDQAVRAAEPAWKGYLALPEAARAAGAPEGVRERCVRGPERGHAELVAEARALAAKGERAGAAACYRAALEPAVLAEVHRANAWFLAGDARRAIAAQEAVLGRMPGHPEPTYFLALFLADTAGDDVAQLRRARVLLDGVARKGVAPQRAADVRNALEEIDRRISTAGLGAR